MNWLKKATLLLCAASVAPFAVAQFTIAPTFDDSTLTGQAKTDFEASINSAIQSYESMITTPITVNITFKADESVGLGQSATYINYLSYSQYRADLAAHATTANDATALAHLPTQSTNPVNGNAQLFLTLPNLRAIGETALGTYSTDSTISLKTSLMNLSRSGTLDSNKYDLIAVTEHEMDEVLGFGSALNGLANGSPAPTAEISPLDLYRYTSTGSRSFDTNLGTEAYFSIDGTTLLTRFNQDGSGDYQDFYTGATPQVQDAFGSPGAILDVGTNEQTALDVLGYTLALTPVPEPATTALLVGMLSLVGIRPLRSRLLRRV